MESLISIRCPSFFSTADLLQSQFEIVHRPPQGCENMDLGRWEARPSRCESRFVTVVGISWSTANKTPSWRALLVKFIHKKTRQTNLFFWASTDTVLVELNRNCRSKFNLRWTAKNCFLRIMNKEAPDDCFKCRRSRVSGGFLERYDGARHEASHELMKRFKPSIWWLRYDSRRLFKTRYETKQ